MLFYLKKHVALELLVAILLGGGGFLGARAMDVELPTRFDVPSLGYAVAGAVALTCWTLLVQAGYAIIKGRDYARSLTLALARHFADASPLQMVAGALGAAGEELFFRGFLQGAFGVVVGALAFMALHIGAKDIRVIGYWSVFQGLGLGLLYLGTGNLLVPVLAHALFDFGAMLHFRRLMATAT